MTGSKSDFSIEELVQETKEDKGRLALIKSQALVELLEGFQGTSSPLRSPERSTEELNCLRVFRNVLASGPAAAEILLEHQAHQKCAHIIQESDSKQAQTVALQVLANLSNHGIHYADQLWEAFFSKPLQAIVAKGIAVLPGAVHMLLANLCKGSRKRAGQFCKEEGLAILEPVLQQLQNDKVDTDTHLEILVASICFGAGCIPAIHAPCQMGNQASMHPSDLGIQAWHCTALNLLCQFVEEGSAKSSLDFSRERPQGESLAAQVLGIIQILSSQEEAERLSNVDKEFLRVSLQFWRAISSLDESDYLSSESAPVVDKFLEDGSLILSLLCMLAALGEVPNRRPDKVSDPSKAWQCPPQLQSSYTRQQPYQGYRTDILTVLANCCYRRRKAQDSVQRLGGIELILENCKVDDTSQFLREAGLWCIRNICEGNISIQKHIDDLKVVDVADSPELEKAGLKIQHESGSGKVQLVKRET